MRGRRQARRVQQQAGRTGTMATPAPTSTGTPGTRFQMRQRLFSIGDDFWIEDDQQRKVFKVDGKALRVRGTLLFEDAHGQELYKIQERLMRVRDTMNIEDASDSVAARVHNALVTPLRDRWNIEISGGENLNTWGNVLYHEYRIGRGRQPVANVSKQWFRVRDSYGVEIAPGEDAALMLAITVVIDMMAHSGRT